MKLQNLISLSILVIFLAGCGNVGVQIQVVPPVDGTPTAQASDQPTPETQAATATSIILPSPTSAPVILGGASAILFSSKRGGDYQDLYLQEFGSGQITRLTHGDSSTFAGPFSPNGKKIVFTGFGLTDSYVGVMNADGSDPVNLTNLPDVSDGFPAWSPDGSQIAFTSRRDGNNELYLMDPYGYNLKRLTNNSVDDFAPTWSPDGKQIAFLSDRDNTAGVYSIYIMNAAASWVKRLTQDGGNDYGPAWSPDGRQIVFRSVVKGQFDIFTVSVDGGDPLNLTNTPNSDEWSPAWSPDGSLIAFQTNRDGNWEIYTMNADGTDPVNLTNNPADDELPYWKPASATTLTRLAFVSSMDGDLALYSIVTDGTMLTRLTSDTMLIMNPVWSPDSNKIAFEGCMGGSMSTDCPAGVSFDIFVVNADGSNLKNITNDASADRSPAWSPDGKLAFSSDRSGKNEIYVMNADGSSLTLVTNGVTSDTQPEWSADGNWLAYQCMQGSETQICIQSLKSGSQPSSLSGTEPVWSPVITESDQRLAFICWSGGHGDICTARPDGSDKKNLTNSPFDEISPSWSADGSWIAYQSNQYNDISLYKICVDCGVGSTPTRLTGSESNANAPAWSPDGTSIAYLSNSDLYIMLADGSGQRVLASNIHGAPVWQP
jgi:Tol biopolymer transport system component